jgi:hypothetical protein
MQGWDAACKEDFAAQEDSIKKIEDGNVLSVDTMP